MDRPFPLEVYQIHDAWSKGVRARDWNSQLIDTALETTAGTPAEGYTRLIAYYHALDNCRFEEARTHIQISIRRAVPKSRVLMEHAFILARLGEDLPRAVAIYECEKDPVDEGLRLRTLAAIEIAEGAGDPNKTLDEAERLLSTHPDRDRDNMQAEADWLRDLRRMM